jgi:hypothetical protein
MSKIWPQPSPLRAIERRLARARPRPDRRFVRHTGRVLGARWAAVDRPAALRFQVLGLLVVGAALLAIAAVIGLA